VKKPSKQWIAILVLVTGVAWGAAATPQHAPAFPHKNLIPGG
jgi:hypothetical protein